MFRAIFRSQCVHRGGERKQLQAEEQLILCSLFIALNSKLHAIYCWSLGPNMGAAMLPYLGHCLKLLLKQKAF